MNVKQAILFLSNNKKVKEFQPACRTWMCGGIIEIIPCSIVGHVTLRKAVSSRSEFGRNSARTALTWLDDYARHYFVRNYQSRDISLESVNERKEIRKKLKCKSFEWFLKNVYPELIVPEDRDGFYGALRNQGLTSLVRTNLRSSRCSIIILFSTPHLSYH